MKYSFEVLAPDLQEVIKKLKNIVPKSTTLPVLEEMSMSVEGQDLFLRATDLEIELSVKLALKWVEGSGTIIVPFNALAKLLAVIKYSGFLRIEGFEDKLIIHKELAEYSITLNTKDEDYPSPINVPEDCYTISYDLRQIKRNLEYVLLAVGKDQLRPTLTGVLLEAKKDSENTFVATDGHVLSQFKDLKTKRNSDGNAEVILPASFCQALLKVFSTKGSGLLRVHSSGKVCSFVQGDVSLRGRLIEGKYPRFRNVIPSETQRAVIIDKKEVLQKLEILSKLTNPISKQIVLLVNPSTITMSGKDIEFGVSGKEELNTKTKDNEQVEIAFNADYLIKCFKSVEIQQISLRFTNTTSAVIIEPHGIVGYNDNYERLLLVMPLRIN